MGAASHSLLHVTPVVRGLLLSYVFNAGSICALWIATSILWLSGRIVSLLCFFFPCSHPLLAWARLKGCGHGNIAHEQQASNYWLAGIICTFPFPPPYPAFVIPPLY